MRSPELGNIFPNPERRAEVVEISEDEAETELATLLAEPQNAFLTEHPQNRRFIEDCESYIDALRFARTRIREGLERTLHTYSVQGDVLESVEANPDAILNTLDHIRKNSVEIGRGADGQVVIDITDEININPEICYKFMLREDVKRGRNSASTEAEFQGAFFQAASELPSKDIGVPMPFYVVEVFNTQLIAMEKLHARSADDLLRGIGTLPDWFDIDRFCASLKTFINAMHEKGLYHRDMHLGNVMITQKPTWQEGEPLGYVIDFGLSGYGLENMDPYRKEVADMVFTYDQDHGRIEQLRRQLHDLQQRIRSKKV